MPNQTRQEFEDFVRRKMKDADFNGSHVFGGHWVYNDPAIKFLWETWQGGKQSGTRLKPSPVKKNESIDSGKQANKVVRTDKGSS